MAWQLISDVRGQQAQSMAYFDCFWMCGVLAAAIVPLVLLMKRPAPKTAAHAIAE
jgi:MFS transporter, DHA2 family, multidrug resistance protein